MSKSIVMKVAGHPLGDLVMEPLSACGSIADGISLHFSAQSQGGFVVDYKDFERAYLAAKKFREENADLMSKHLKLYGEMRGTR